MEFAVASTEVVVAVELELGAGLSESVEMSFGMPYGMRGVRVRHPPADRVADAELRAPVRLVEDACA